MTHSSEHRSVAVVLLCILEIPRCVFGVETNYLDLRLLLFISASLVKQTNAYEWSEQPSTT